MAPSSRPRYFETSSHHFHFKIGLFWSSLSAVKVKNLQITSDWRVSQTVSRPIISFTNELQTGTRLNVTIKPVKRPSPAVPGVTVWRKHGHCTFTPHYRRFMNTVRDGDRPRYAVSVYRLTVVHARAGDLPAVLNGSADQGLSHVPLRPQNVYDRVCHRYHVVKT